MGLNKKHLFLTVFLAVSLWLILQPSSASAALSGQMTLYFHPGNADASTTGNLLTLTPPGANTQTVSADAAKVSTSTVACEAGAQMTNNTINEIAVDDDVAGAAGTYCLASFYSMPMGQSITISTSDTDGLYGELFGSNSNADNAVTNFFIELYQWDGASTYTKFGFLTTGDAGIGAITNFKLVAASTTPLATITLAATDRIVATLIMQIITADSSSGNNDSTSIRFGSKASPLFVRLGYTASSTKPSLTGSKDDDFTTGTAQEGVDCTNSGAAYNGKWTCTTPDSATLGNFVVDATSTSWLILRDVETGVLGPNISSSTIMYQTVDTNADGDGSVTTVVNSVSDNPSGTSPFYHAGLLLLNSSATTTDYLILQSGFDATNRGVQINNSGTLSNSTNLAGNYNRLYLRWTKTGTNYQAAYSTDGASYTNLGSAISHATTFTKAGFNVYNAAINTTYAGAFDWFDYALAAAAADAEIFLPANQTFEVLQATSTALSPIKVKAGLGGGGSITTTNDIRIRIDDNFPMIMGTSTGLSCTTTGGGTVDCAQSAFSANRKELFIPVTTNFSNNADVVISNLEVDNFTAANAASTSMRLYIDGGTAIENSATATIAVKGTITLANHNLEQLSDQFSPMLENETSTTTELIRFKLTPNGESASTTIRLTYSTSGIADGDITSGNLYGDTNNNGRVDSVEGAIMNCGAPASGTIACNGTTTIHVATSTIYRATISNLAINDSITMNAVSTSNIIAVGTTSQTYVSRLTVSGSTGAIIHIKAKDVTVNSAYSQNFILESGATPIAPVTIKVYQNGKATTSTDFRIIIPSTLAMEWDPADTFPSVGGNAAAKVDNTQVFFEDSNKTMRIDIQSDFAAGDEIEIGALKFKNFTSVSGPVNLELYTGGAEDSVADAVDGKIKQVIGSAGGTAAISSPSENASGFQLGSYGGTAQGGGAGISQPSEGSSGFQQGSYGGTSQSGGGGPSE